MKFKKAEIGFAALAQESRLAVYRMLVEKWPEGMSAGAIAEALAIPATTLSFHLSQLSTAKLVDSQKEGRSIIYSANMKRARKLAKFLTRKTPPAVAEGEIKEPLKL